MLFEIVGLGKPNLIYENVSLTNQALQFADVYKMQILMAIFATLIATLIIKFFKEIVNIFNSVVLKFVHFAIDKRAGARGNIPHKTLAITPHRDESKTYWKEGVYEGDPCMFICLHLFVKNLWGESNRISRVDMMKPKSEKRNYSVLLRPLPSDEAFIPNRETREIIVDFLIAPPIKKRGENFKVNLEVIDRFGNKHLLKNVMVYSRH